MAYVLPTYSYSLANTGISAHTVPWRPKVSYDAQWLLVMHDPTRWVTVATLFQ